MKTEIEGWIFKDRYADDRITLYFGTKKPVNKGEYYSSDNFMLTVPIKSERLPDFKPMQCKRATITIELK